VAGGSDSDRRSVRTRSTLRRLVGIAEKEMAVLGARRDELAADLAAAGSDYVVISRVGTELGSVEERLAAAEQRWLELAEELEA
jgi:hypothetical protein